MNISIRITKIININRPGEANRQKNGKIKKRYKVKNYEF